MDDAWMTHMRRGEFDAAWKISDAVLRSRAGMACDHLPRHLQYLWDGRRLDGRRVLIRCYHGLGDTIQFIRYAPLLKEIGAEVTVWAQPELIPLLATAAGIDHLLPLHDGAPEGEYDADIEIMELPHIFRTSISSIPLHLPYLHAEPVPLPRDERLAVGLVWQAGEWDRRRSIPATLLPPLAAIPGIRLYLLQRGVPEGAMPPGLGEDIGTDDPCQAARIISALDLMISVDSMPAHLAGALGVPAWTLLHADADWRWMEGREDSPWYPMMRLFRQEVQGEWGPVISRVQAELEGMIEARRHSDGILPTTKRRRDASILPGG